MAAAYLVQDEASHYRLRVGAEEPIARVFAASVEDDQPVVGAAVRFRVVAGTARIRTELVGGAFGESTGNGTWDTEIELRSDESGTAGVMARLESRGRSLVEVSLVGEEREPSEPVVFSLMSSDLAAEITIDAPRFISADDGEILAAVSVVDAEGAPVSGLELSVSATQDNDIESGRAIESAPGRYAATVALRKQGCWLFSVQDKESRTVGTECVTVEPGVPVAVEQVGTADPRAESPFDRTTLRVRLVDAHDNGLRPHALLATTSDGKSMQPVSVDDEAWFELQRVGNRSLTVRVYDEQSGLELETGVLFAGYWAVVPNLVELRSGYRMGILAQPTTNRALEGGYVRVGYDGLQTIPDLESFEPAEGVTIKNVTAESDTVRIDYKLEKPVPAEKIPYGYYLGEFEWECVGHGETCIDVGGGMSPDVPIWRKCYEQKSYIENLKEVCVNIIYRPRRRQDRRTGTAMVRQAMATITGMTYFCCPWITYCWNQCEMSGAQYLTLINEWNNLLPWGEDDVEFMIDSGICQRANCINLFVMPIRNPNLSGMSKIGPPGTMAIDPNAFNSRTRIAAHEFGHALGLRHRRRDRYALMRPTAPHGRLINRSECETIGRTLESYPC